MSLAAALVPALLFLGSSPAGAQSQPGVDTPAPATDPVCVYTPTDYAYAFLHELGVPASANNLESILAWEMAEGGNWIDGAKFNPQNTTWPGAGESYDGSTEFNSAGVQSFVDWDDGVYATVATLTDGGTYPNGDPEWGYDKIVSDLASSAAPGGPDSGAGTTTYDIDNSAWGTTNAQGYVGQSYDPPAPAWDSPCVGDPSVLVNGPSNTLTDYWEGPGGQWTSALIGNSGSAYSAPSLAVSGTGQAYVAVQGPGDSLWTYWTAGSGAGTWYGPLGISGAGSAYSVPSVAMGPTGLPTVAVEGPDNTLWLYWMAANAQWYGPLQVGGPGTTYSAPSLAIGPSGLPKVAVQGPNDTLWLYWEGSDAQWYGPLGVGGTNSTYGAPSLAVGPSGLPKVAVQGPNDTLWLYWEGSDAQWYGPLGVGGTNSTYGEPSLAVSPQGLPTIAVQGQGDSLWVYWESSNSQWYGPLGVAGPNSTPDPPAAGMNPSG